MRCLSAFSLQLWTDSGFSSEALKSTRCWFPPLDPLRQRESRLTRALANRHPHTPYPLEGTWPEHMQAPGAHFWGAFSMGPSQRWASYTPSSCLTLGNPKNRSDPISFLNLPQEDAPLGGDFPRQGHSPWSGLLGVAGLIRGGGGHRKHTDST